MEQRDRDALTLRIDRQGWGQGSLVDFKHWAFLANADAPTSELGEQIARREGIESGAFVAQALAEEQVGVVVTSQACDLVADAYTEPFCEAMPLVRVPEGQRLPQANSTRGFVIAADQRLVVDGSYRLVFEKSLLPDRSATQLLQDDTRRRLFAAWLARRSARAAFPNDFAATVGRSIGWVWRKNRFATDALAQHLYQWRVGFYGNREDHVDFLVPYDERAVEDETAREFVHAFFAEVRARLPLQTAKAREYEAEHGGAGIRAYTIGRVHTRPATKVSMRQMLSMPSFNLEDLTYEANAIVGAESRTESEG